MAAPTLPEAIAQGERAMAVVLEAADETWAEEARKQIMIGLSWGDTFIAEDIVIRLAEEGFATRNAKAIGPIIRRIAREGYITKTGNARPARTSHGSLKPEWVRISRRLGGEGL